MQRSFPMSSLNLNRPLPPVARVLFNLALLALAWEERRKTRLSLARLDPHMLRDIGLTEQAAEAEASKPFWQG